MEVTINALQGSPSLDIIRDGKILVKVYSCQDGMVASTGKENFIVPRGVRSIDGQVGEATEVNDDGFVIYMD